MTLMEADQFYTTKLCGLFTKWAPTQAQYEFWTNKLKNTDKAAAEQALEVYVEVKTKTEDEPTWARFAEHLRKVKPVQEAKHLSDSSVWLVAQCYSHRIPAIIGAIHHSKYVGCREHSAVEDYQIMLGRGKGGFWQAAVAYGINGLRQALRDMRPRRNKATDNYLNQGYRIYSMDFRKPLEREYYLDEITPLKLPEHKPHRWQSLSCAAEYVASSNKIDLEQQNATEANYGDIEDMAF